MSAPELPDDPRAWPADPFALLGVARGAAEMDVKRAYTRLIRRFKPERFPEQFRRVREAYEACLDQGRWFFPRDFPVPDFTPPRPPVEDAPPPDDADVPEVRELPRPAPLVDEAERLWAAAVAGRTDEAYAGLASLADALPDRADLPLRLYWLLGLHPALDATRTRHDWLAAALTRARLTGPAAELYRRELGLDPDTALYGPYLKLLTTDADPRTLLTVARWRLAAAGRSRSWTPADGDLQELAKRLPFHDESGWLGFVVSANDWAAWDRPWPLYQSVRRELDGLRHLELSRADAFDRVEETDRLTTSRYDVAAAAFPPELYRLLPIAWAGYGDVPAADATAAAAAVVADPAGGLVRLDRFVRDRGPALLVVAARALDRFLRERDGYGADFPADLIRGLAAAFRGGWARVYRELRGDLLDFLAAEAIHPDEFAAACAVHPDHRVREAADPLRADVPLRLVWLARRIHGG